MKFQSVSVERICVSCGEEFHARSPRQTRCRQGCERDRKWNRTIPVQFVAIDGEGLGADPSKYVLLGCGTEQLENSSGLEFPEICEFLYQQFLSYPKGTAFIGFFLNYDFTQWIKSIPQDRAWYLLTTEGRARRETRQKGREPFPVEWAGWQFDLLGNKRFRLRPKQCVCKVVQCRCPKASWMYICDAGGFWQTSLLSVLDPGRWGQSPICTTAEFETIKRGKKYRPDATLDDDMREYNKLENIVFVRAMERLNEGFEGLGIHLTPRQWFGPGQGAQEWLKQHLPKSQEYLKDSPKWYLDAARDSYFGGWFEIMAHGIMKGVTHEYDINSAYPSVIARLPCLSHGRYSRGTGPIPQLAQKDLLLVRTRLQSCSPTAFDRDKRYYIGAALHRDSKGNISRPLLTEGWFWWNEILASVSARCARKPRPEDIKEWVRYEPCGCPPPLMGMADLYVHRLAVGKDTPEGMACKLLYNSAYGKFAQSVGHPAFGNPIYASLITSGCREMILNAIATHPGGKRAVLMVATDAVFFDEPHPSLPVSDTLGEWGYKPRRNLTLFKPGVYWDDKTREALRRDPDAVAQFKSRGVNAREFGKCLESIDLAFHSWSQDGANDWPSVEFNPGFTMVTGLQALQRHKWYLAGKPRDASVPVKQDSWYGGKRRGIYFDEKGVWRSEPFGPRWSEQLGDFDCISSPYRKSFGLDDPFSEETEEEWGVNQDGPVRATFRELLKSGWE